jgi:hypothetical protein
MMISHTEGNSFLAPLKTKIKFIFLIFSSPLNSFFLSLSRYSFSQHHLPPLFLPHTQNKYSLFLLMEKEVTRRRRRRKIKKYFLSGICCYVICVVVHIQLPDKM